MTIGANQSESARGLDEADGASPEGSAAPIEASVVAADDSEAATTYQMYEARDLSAEGAFLVGELLLEVGEQVTLQLETDGQPPVRAQARVVRLERGDRIGMAVAFQELGDAERSALESLATRAVAS